MADRTSIAIETATWQRLNRRKMPGESFDDVVTALLDSADKRHERHEIENDD
jgi:predicted CopG family antitoxin